MEVLIEIVKYFGSVIVGFIGGRKIDLSKLGKFSKQKARDTGRDAISAASVSTTQTTQFIQHVDKFEVHHHHGDPDGSI